MEILIERDAEAVARSAAGVVIDQLGANPRTVLGLATGSSPLGLYQELAAAVRDGRASLAGCRGFLLDEYVGLPAGHPERYRTVIQRELVDQVDLDPDRVQGPDGLADDLDEAAARYEAAIREAGGVDLQVLGVGANGHIAFNEPGSSLASRTRPAVLTQRTREANARFFEDEIDAVPRRCLTQGIGTILEARHLLMVVAGEHKAEAVAQFVEGPVSARCPASALQLHPRVTVCLDEAAASRLELGDYYREVRAAGPAAD